MARAETGIVPYAATGAAAELQALADCRMQPERTVSFPGSAVGDVLIRQQPGAALGAYAWRAGIELVGYLERTLGEQLVGLRVLELGSGTGLTAIALARLGATVVATDFMPDLVKLARKNMSANGIPSERCTAQVYEWGAPLPAQLRQPFDLVVASEVTALEGTKDGLLAALRDVLAVSSAAGAPPPRVVLAETRRNEQQPLFWQRAEQAYTVVQCATVAQSDPWNTLDREEPVRIFELAPRSQEEPPTQAPATEAALLSLPPLGPESPAVAQARHEIFRDEEKLDGYGMSMADMELFKTHGYAAADIGKLCTYGAVLHHGVPLLFQAVASGAFGGDLAAAVEGRTFLDLGSADGRCVLSAALHFGGLGELTVGGRRCGPTLRRAVGVELSLLRHELAVKWRERSSLASLRDRVHLVHGDVLGPEASELIAKADVIYAANLRFPPEVNERLGAHLLASMDPSRDCFVLTLAALRWQQRQPLASWAVSVPMTWNPAGCPVTCHHFGPVLA